MYVAVHEQIAVIVFHGHLAEGGYASARGYSYFQESWSASERILALV